MHGRFSNHQQSLPPAHAEHLARGELARVAYRLGHARATGILAIYPSWGRPEVFVLRRGVALAGTSDSARISLGRRLARAAAFDHARHSWGGGEALSPPAMRAGVELAGWARRHIEAQVDQGRASAIIRELAGVRLGIRAELCPPAALCDATDLRICAAMTSPRRLDQIAAAARAPRFRLAAFVHFLRRVGALELCGVAAPAPSPMWPAEIRARRILGVQEGASRDDIKRAYRKLCRALHPDLRGEMPPAPRRDLEHKLSVVTAAYRQLVGARPA
ncbi:MAG TPA: J domain-containing protein [Kofleriaceae bacterium]|nr:J domain-containing protein [Kofleriaceae bacterium]